MYLIERGVLHWLIIEVARYSDMGVPQDVPTEAIADFLVLYTASLTYSEVGAVFLYSVQFLYTSQNNGTG